MLWWARKKIIIGKQVPSQSAMPAGSQLQGPCLQLAGSRHMSPRALAWSPCPGEDDEGCCLLRPARTPGIALSLAPGCWGGINLLQPSKGAGSGSVSSSRPTAVSHQDFCLLIWMCREATDRCAGIVQTQQSSSHHQSLHPYHQPYAAWGFHS